MLELALEKNLTPLLVVAAALERGGMILMQQRRFESMHGGLWEFPGGKVEPGESPEEALVREIAEELAVTLSVADLEPVAFASGGGKGEGRAIVILLYLCREWSGEPLLLDGESIAWHAPEAVAELPMPPLDYPLAEALCRHLV